MHWVLLFLVACSAGEPSSTKTADTHTPGTPDPDTSAPPLEHAFTFAVITDTHVTREGESLDRMNQAVDWLVAESDAQDIELVFILGDIAWGGGFELARASLDRLPVAWVPIQGDNPIQVGDEAKFQPTFASQLSTLSDTLPGWRLAPSPVDNPEREALSYLHNFAFDHGPVRFVGLDWNTREVHPLWGETPDTHDFDGGTLPFLRDELTALADGPDGRLIVLTHMPMFFGPGGYDEPEATALIDTLAIRPGAVQHNLCGHLHGNGEHHWDDAGIDVLITDATFDDANTVRRVEVWTNGEQVVLVSEVFDVR